MGDDKTEIDAQEIIEELSDEEEMCRVIDQDEEIVYDNIVWDQQNVRLKKEGVILTNQEKRMVISLNSGVTLLNIAQNEQKELDEINPIFDGLCNKLCAKNQKEALQRAKDLNLL